MVRSSALSIRMITQEFVNKTCRSLIISEADPATLINRFRDFKPLFSDKTKWAKMVEKNETQWSGPPQFVKSPPANISR